MRRLRKAASGEATAEDLEGLRGQFAGLEIEDMAAREGAFVGCTFVEALMHVCKLVCGPDSTKYRAALPASNHFMVGPHSAVTGTGLTELSVWRLDRDLYVVLRT